MPALKGRQKTSPLSRASNKNTSAADSSHGNAVQDADLVAEQLPVLAPRVHHHAAAPRDDVVGGAEAHRPMHGGRRAHHSTGLVHYQVLGVCIAVPGPALEPHKDPPGPQQGGLHPARAVVEVRVGREELQAAVRLDEGLVVGLAAVGVADGRPVRQHLLRRQVLRDLDEADVPLHVHGLARELGGVQRVVLGREEDEEPAVDLDDAGVGYLRPDAGAPGVLILPLHGHEAAARVLLARLVHGVAVDHDAALGEGVADVEAPEAAARLAGDHAAAVGVAGGTLVLQELQGRGVDEARPALDVVAEAGPRELQADDVVRRVPGHGAPRPVGLQHGERRLRLGPVAGGRHVDAQHQAARPAVVLGELGRCGHALPPVRAADAEEQHQRVVPVAGGAEEPLVRVKQLPRARGAQVRGEPSHGDRLRLLVLPNDALEPVGTGDGEEVLLVAVEVVVLARPDVAVQLGDVGPPADAEAAQAQAERAAGLEPRPLRGGGEALEVSHVLLRRVEHEDGRALELVRRHAHVRPGVRRGAHGGSADDVGPVVPADHQIHARRRAVVDAKDARRPLPRRLLRGAHPEAPVLAAVAVAHGAHLVEHPVAVLVAVGVAAAVPVAPEHEHHLPDMRPRGHLRQALVRARRLGRQGGRRWHGRLRRREHVDPAPDLQARGRKAPRAGDVETARAVLQDVEGRAPALLGLEEDHVGHLQPLAARRLGARHLVGLELQTAPLREAPLHEVVLLELLRVVGAPRAPVGPGEREAADDVADPESRDGHVGVRPAAVHVRALQVLLLALRAEGQLGRLLRCEVEGRDRLQGIVWTGGSGTRVLRELRHEAHVGASGALLQERVALRGKVRVIIGGANAGSTGPLHRDRNGLLRHATRSEGKAKSHSIEAQGGKP
eukprot:CAMPEP_0175316518 /NCGR_PEP_ID=MMETSP0093-20121207/69455_1 /TAXON_ID=311494 /ORGANISM="Alexandrium monilatum, Strain CCMP3105" /LENGTH=894 /DNA_ID=CAMNT_0016613287 /DNA_START=33 /DNA_END=2715 /DNA_ORIENTATION=+